MRKMLIVAVGLLVSACERPQTGSFDFADGQAQHAVIAAEIDWRPCPPHLPPGCEAAVLEGNPQSDGMFTVRFRVAGGFIMAPHTHPRDERVTVLSGKVTVAFGDDAREFGPGDYYVNAPNVVHTVRVDEPTEIQVTGIGPWEVHFAD